MIFELSQTFFFDAAHTLDRVIDGEASRRIHGHTYHAEITVTGNPDTKTGMILDLGLLKEKVEKLRLSLDHQFLDELLLLGPATLENLCKYIWQELRNDFVPVISVKVGRQASGDACRLTADEFDRRATQCA